MEHDNSIRDKKFDLPPRGPRNPDPITNAPGAHPIETGVGAALIGAAAGLGIGAVAGPVGVVVGAAAGAIAGGFAGHGIGEWMDPTIEDNAMGTTVEAKPAMPEGQTFDRYQPGYPAESLPPGQDWLAVEDRLPAELQNPNPAPIQSQPVHLEPPSIPSQTQNDLLIGQPPSGNVPSGQHAFDTNQAAPTDLPRDLATEQEPDRACPSVSQQASNRTPPPAP